LKEIIKILKYAVPYKKEAFLNIFFNILSVIFSLFSLTMVAPFLDLLFLKTDIDYEKQLLKGEPIIELSIDSAVNNFYYFLTKMIIEQGKLQTLLLICILVVSIIFLKNLCRYMAMFFLAKIRNGVVQNIRNNIYTKVLALPLGYYSEERKGDIMSRMTADVQEIEWSVMSSLEMIFRDPLNVLIFLITLVFMSPQLTIFVLVLLPITGFIIARVAKSLKKTSTQGKEKMGILLSLMDETLSGLRIIKAFNAETKVDNRFKEVNSDYTKLMIKMYRKTDLASPMSEFLAVLVLVIIMFFGGKLVLGDTPELSASVFITYIAVFSQLIPPAKSFTSAFYNIQKGLASSERVQKILDAQNNIVDNTNSVEVFDFKEKINFNNVSFSYAGSEEVLKNINFEILKGKMVALVGRSGAGKSTIADLLPRFYDVTEGAVEVDGKDIRNIKIKSLRNLMGIVSQESILFNDSIFNNICFGVENATKEEVENAAKIANAHDFIIATEEGYETNIGDRGSKLSGGQRQRLSIARAVLKNPPILILDEATSALDNESEKLVQDALFKLMKSRTTLVIAHRLSTIINADTIIVMDNGKIIDSGTHDDLLVKSSYYQQLYQLSH
jgi:ATP-binding cassette, subfamily B, bacterial MsbA